MISGQEIDRRTFMKIGGTALAANLVPALETEPRSVSETPYLVKWYPFTGHPDSDTCWSLSVGPTVGSMRRLARRAYPAA